MNNSQETKIVATDNVALAKKLGFNKWVPERAQYLKDEDYHGDDVKAAEEAGVETGYVPEETKDESVEDVGKEEPSAGNSTERSSTSTESKSSATEPSLPAPVRTTGSDSKPDPKASSTAPQTGGSGTASQSASKGSDK